MNSIQFKYTYRYDIKSVDFLRFDNERRYSDVLSPFSRIYLVTDGLGSINIEGKLHQLEKGFLYLVPSFKRCTYQFDANFEHYYLHFQAKILNGLNPYHLFRVQSKIKATQLDQALFERILSLNPEMTIPHPDPNIYQRKDWMFKPVKYHSISHYNENRGIMDQLLSRFIVSQHAVLGNEFMRYNMQAILAYIHDNIQEHISIQSLADMACLSKDHFTRIFKRFTRLAPREYMIQLQIERAQYLLLATDKSIKSIVDETGFKNPSYFSRSFKKHTKQSPFAYRKTLKYDSSNE